MCLCCSTHSCGPHMISTALSNQEYFAYWSGLWILLSRSCVTDWPDWKSKVASHIGHCNPWPFQPSQQLLKWWTLLGTSYEGEVILHRFCYNNRFGNSGTPIVADEAFFRISIVVDQLETNKDLSGFCGWTTINTHTLTWYTMPMPQLYHLCLQPKWQTNFPKSSSGRPSGVVSPLKLKNNHPCSYESLEETVQVL